MARLIVADAGPLIAFGRLEKLALLPKVLGEVLVPEAVVAECLVDLQKPGASAIREALETRTLIQIGDPVPALSPFPYRISAAAVPAVSGPHEWQGGAVQRLLEGQLRHAVGGDAEEGRPGARCGNC